MFVIADQLSMFTDIRLHAMLKTRKFVKSCKKFVIEGVFAENEKSNSEILLDH